MTAPPGIAPTTETAAGHDRQVSDTALTSKREAIRYLRDQLQITGAQANRMYVAYQRDQERPAVTAGATYRLSFLAWLMEQAPVKRNREVLKRQWAVTS